MIFSLVVSMFYDCSTSKIYHYHWSMLYKPFAVHVLWYICDLFFFSLPQTQRQCSMTWIAMEALVTLATAS